MLNLKTEQTKDFFTFFSQDGFVMSSNLRENIVFEYDASTIFVEGVLTALHQAEFAMNNESLSNGLETEIGERGVNLSGGQKQRVSLARAIFYDRPIVLLDDSLSAVDVDTERKLVQNLLLGTWNLRTRILVSHRLSVLQYVDRIVYLENGKISEIGTLAQLLLRSESFRNFTSSNHELKSLPKIEPIDIAPPNILASDIDQGAK